ncbi:MAG: fibronectin type III domain-containing protein [Thermoanaerobaculia bacterium]|nr:fibronectin type III domain-containing protein [Thermoanaerobaculia bacterium]
MQRRASTTLRLLVALPLLLATAGLGQGRYVELGPMPFSNAEAGAAELDGLVYVVGGFNDEEALMIYDPATDEWERGPDIPQGVHHPAVAGHDGRIYVVGGHEAESLVQIYDPVSESWSTADGRVPTPRRAMGIVVLDGRIHVMGGTSGIRGGGGHVEHEAYDPATDTWVSLAPLLEPREHGYAAVMDDKIYYASGRRDFEPQPELQIYDPAKDEWTFGPRLIEAVSGHVVQAVDNRLFALGGEAPLIGHVTRRSQRYDPFAEVWDQVVDLPLPLHAAANAVYRGSIYLFGGIDIVEGSSLGRVNVYRFDPPSIRNPAPFRLKAKALKRRPGRVRLKWKLKRNLSDATSFQVQSRLEGEPWQDLATPGIGAKRLTVSGLEPGATYGFRVRANGPAGPSEWSAERTVRLPD